MTARVQEQAFTFDCEGESLVGVLHAPAAVPARLGFVIVVGGPQYRVGSHRHFVTMARTLAEAGYPVLRFDVRGMGDSTGSLHSFEHITADIGAAVNALLSRQPGIDRVALWGLCDGASAALLYLQRQPDPRVAALCLINPWVRSETSQARTQVKHYYLERIRQREFWSKLLRGQVAGQALAGLLRNIRTALGGHAAADAPAEGLSYQDRMLSACQAFHGPALVLLSRNDYTAKEFVEFTSARTAWQHWLSGPGVSRQWLDDADHTFSDALSKQRVSHITLTWARSACT